MSDRTDRLNDPHARRFHGYQGDAPVHLGDALHIDAFEDGRYFYTGHPDSDPPLPTYISRDELVAAARAILRHFDQT